LYRLYRCGTCGVVFAEPRDPIGPEWYVAAAPLRATDARESSDPSKDWRYRRFLAEGLPPGKVLDIGCGDGGFLSLAAERGWTCVGVDYEERMIALARAKGLDATAKEFDAVVLFDVLEHATEPRDLLERVKPVLKRGGHLAVTLPNDRRPRLFPRELYDYPPHHFTRWNADSLGALLRSEGFAVVRAETPGPSAWWFSEEMFFAWIAPPAVALARKILFGPEASGTLSQLYGAGQAASSAVEPDGLKRLLADGGRRQKATNALKRACRLFTLPLGAVLSVFYRLLRPGSGEHLFVLARYDA
jgi:SAM-dependent methyltransferase